jgi:hypothetical protein
VDGGSKSPEAAAGEGTSDRLLRARLWKLYDEGRLFGRLRGGRGGAVEYMKQLYMQQLEHPDED